MENEHVGNVDQYKVVKDVRLPYDEKRKSVSDEDVRDATNAFNLSIEPESQKPMATTTSINNKKGEYTLKTKLVMTIPQSEQLTEGGARGRPAAKDYERRPNNTSNGSYNMNRHAFAMSDDDESASASASNGSDGSGYDDSDFENTLAFSDDNRSNEDVRNRLRNTSTNGSNDNIESYVIKF